MKILIVEDEPSLREGLVDLLRREGHTVEAVGDGEAALSRGSDPSIQMMLLDLMLPKLDGIEVCRRLRFYTRSVADEVDRLGRVMANVLRFSRLQSRRAGAGF